MAHRKWVLMPEVESVSNLIKVAIAASVSSAVITAAYRLVVRAARAV